MTEEQIEQLAEEVAKRTIREFMLTLGIATRREEDALEIQQDFSWLRKQRKVTEKIASHIKLTVIGSMVGGALFLLWEGIKLAVTNKG